MYFTILVEYKGAIDLKEIVLLVYIYTFTLKYGKHHGNSNFRLAHF